MPTILQRAKAAIEGDRGAAHTNTAGQPLYMPNQGAAQSGDQPLGGKSAGKRSTPPDSVPEHHIDRTPPPHAKVLPWVIGIQTEGYSPPDGMFGPYDSQPPTRPHTMHDATVPPPQGRPVHPYAYTPGQSIPFAALQQPSGLADPAEITQAVRQEPTRESEVLSRGAGVRALAGQGDVGESTPGQSGSVGMGTFGRDPKTSQEVLGAQAGQRSGSPLKGTRSQAGTGYVPLQDPLPPAPPAKSSTSPARRVPVPNEGAATAAAHPTGGKQTHVHQPHHEFPFSHVDAAQKQQEAMNAARTQALAQLEATKPNTTGLGGQPPGTGVKGPRGTYETSTSGPSFGHILHQDGQPLRLSGPPLPPGHPQSVPMSREDGGQMPFMRIPFGVPLGASIPRPLFVMRNSAGVEMGVGLGGPTGVQNMSTPPQNLTAGQSGDSPRRTPERRKEDRSAYVETIEDEQAPTVTIRTPTKAARSAVSVSPDQRQVQTAPSQSAARTAMTTAGLGTTTAAPHARVPSGLSTKSHGARTRHSRADSHDDGSVTVRDAPSEALSRPASYAPTTTSNVKQLVASSKFHDDTLCQLLDAARLNLIGGEAKKALNRAARARVTELKDMKARGEIDAVPDVGGLKRHHRKKSKDRSGRKSERGRAESVEPVTPPQWAQDIMTRLEAFDARFSELEQQKHNREFFGEHGPPSQDYVGDMLDDLIYNELGPEFGHIMGFQRGPMSGVPALGSNLTAQAIPNMLNSAGYRSETPQRQMPSRMGGSIHTIPPTVLSQPQNLAASAGQVQRMGSAGGPGDLTWGSDVELPQASESAHPPMPAAPTINIQPPTESNIGKSSYRVPSGPTYSQATARTPPGMPQPHDIVFEAPGGVIHGQPMERDLPAAPSDSILSQRQSPIVGPGPMPDQPTPQTPASQASRLVSPPNQGGTAQSTAFVTAPKSILQPERTYVTPPQGAQPLSPGRDRIHVTDSMPTEDKVDPWDLVTQKLYSWALVWEEETFVRAMERMSLGSQVEEFPLTIFMMMTYKRLIRHNLTSIPVRVCDKLFVPSTIASAINAAVHNKQFENAAQFLEELWSSYQLSPEPPRVIVTLAKHRNEASPDARHRMLKLTKQTDLWTAHRFDMTSHHLTSYGVSHEEHNLKDGRPFMWWYAIRLAWPQCKIPDPFDAGLQVRFEHIRSSPEQRNSNSLVAANIARNLLLGYRPERPTDYAKMRELVWAEVKRLLQKKRSGRLIVDTDSADHVYEI